MVTVLITGGSGLVGTALSKVLLAKGYAVIILGRSAAKKSDHPALSYATWDIEKQQIDKEAVGTADYIIHLAGASVIEKKWTAKRRQEIIDSRVKSSDLLVKALTGYPNKVKAVISTSAIGYYGEDRGHSKPFAETDPSAAGFLADVCRLWEESIQPVTGLNKRLAIFRIGIVLSPEGGALKEFCKPLAMNVAAYMGNGKQIVSWIHIDDLVAMYIAAIEKEEISGVYNAVAPQPVSNKALLIQLAKSKGKRFYLPFPVPAFLLRLALGERSQEILKSATVSSDKIESSGFVFSYPSIKKALDSFFS